MTKYLSLLLAVCSLVLVVGTLSGFCDRLNPYAPVNATAAEPMTPYNLYETARISREAYGPCPMCGYAGYLMPDVPPISAPIKGPMSWDWPVP